MSRAPVVSAILAAGGLGTRLGADRPKQFLDLHGRSILELSLAALANHPGVHEVIVALPAGHLDPAPACVTAAWPCRVTAVAGGERRQDSVAAAFAAIAATTDVVLVHDAARPFASADLVSRMIAAAVESGAAIPAVAVADTVKRGEVRDGRTWVASTLPRAELFLAQTPQAFSRSVLASALELAGAEPVTDEAGLVERSGGAVQLVVGEAANVKITTAEDLAAARATASAGPPAAFRIGTGYDLHRLVPDRVLVLGGVRIPFEMGLDGHSDADIICHAVTDAVLGAAALGDIGRLFPDTDAAWKDADSLALLRAAVAVVHDGGFRVGNVDLTVIAERPKLLPYVAAMRANLAAALQVDSASVSVKGKTNERLDSMGRGESMACHAVALLVRAAGAPEPRVPSREPRP
jgi:2-C-methyl-D-erythritol 4-phosphate cytidylyltransferase / 2-C-methyl-D-erythritol 2,4-cyclodiphosphate synthase